MPKTSHKKPTAEYITPLYINGLQGRVLHMPAPKRYTREILLVYGHHSSLERLVGLAETFNDYGAVTMPDLPGFGGMDSFYKIHQKPSLDAMADYLATFVKLHYRRRRFTVAGLSYGFLVVTRMLQRYPDIAKKVDLVISVVGFTHHDEFNFSRPRFLFYKNGARFFSHRLPAIFFRNVILNSILLRIFYNRTHNAKQKFVDLTKTERKAATEFEIYLWHCNDVRTYMYSAVTFLTVDNCQVPLKVPVWHVSVEEDHYFNNHVVEQHMQVIFDEFHSAPATFKHHSMTIIADKAASAPFVPAELRALLAKQ